MLADICDRCDAVEECYEFLLAYAAQGRVNHMSRLLADPGRSTILEGRAD
jgi:hypothetical protein